MSMFFFFLLSISTKWVSCTVRVNQGAFTPTCSALLAAFGGSRGWRAVPDCLMEAATLVVVAGESPWTWVDGLDTAMFEAKSVTL